MAVMFWYLVKGDFSSVRYHVHAKTVESFFTRYQKLTAMYNWSPCRWPSSIHVWWGNSRGYWWWWSQEHYNLTLILTRSLKLILILIENFCKIINKNHQSLVHYIKGGTIYFFELRYSGSIKKLRNGLNKKSPPPKKKFKIFWGQTRNLQKTEFTRLRDFRCHNFCVYEPILSFLVRKMFKI